MAASVWQFGSLQCSQCFVWCRSGSRKLVLSDTRIPQSRSAPTPCQHGQESSQEGRRRSTKSDEGKEGIRLVRLSEGASTELLFHFLTACIWTCACILLHCKRLLSAMLARLERKRHMLLWHCTAIWHATWFCHNATGLQWPSVISVNADKLQLGSLCAL